MYGALTFVLTTYVRSPHLSTITPAAAVISHFHTVSVYVLCSAQYNMISFCTICNPLQIEFYSHIQCFP
jgi:hypothetical protein